MTKRQFGHVKVRYRGLAKNIAQLYMLFALSDGAANFNGSADMSMPANGQKTGPQRLNNAAHSDPNLQTGATGYDQHISKPIAQTFPGFIL